MTNDESRCAFYKAESQNVKVKYYCNPPEKYRDELAKKNGRRDLPKIPISKDECEVRIFWLTRSFPMHPFSTPSKHQKTVRS